MVTIRMEMKGEWKFASRDTGEQSVIAHGIIEMPKSYADNLGLDQQVIVCIHLCSHMNLQ